MQRDINVIVVAAAVVVAALGPHRLLWGTQDKGGAHWVPVSGSVMT